MYEKYADYERDYSSVAGAYTSFDWLPDPDPRRAHRLYLNATAPALGLLVSGRTSIAKKGAQRTHAIGPVELYNFGTTHDDTEAYAPDQSPDAIYLNARGTPQFADPVPETEQSTGAVLHYDRGWHFLMNDSWVLGGVHGHVEFHLASPRDRDNIFDSEAGHLTVFGRELIGLLALGYEIEELYGMEIAHCVNRDAASTATLAAYLAEIERAEEGSWEHVVSRVLALQAGGAAVPLGSTTESALPLESVTRWLESDRPTVSVVPWPAAQPVTPSRLDGLRAKVEEAATREGLELGSLQESSSSAMATLLSILPEDREPELVVQDNANGGARSLALRGAAPLSSGRSVAANDPTGDVGVELVLTPSGDSVSCKVGLSLPDAVKWDVMPGVEVGGLRLRAEFEPESVPSVDVCGSLTTEAGVVDLGLRLPLSDPSSDWTFRCRPSAEAPLGLTGACRLVGLRDDLPVPGFLDSVRVSEAAFRLSPDNGLKAVSLTAEATPTLKLGPLRLEACLARFLALSPSHGQRVSVELAMIAAVRETKFWLYGETGSGGLRVAGHMRGSLRQLAEDLVGSKPPDALPDIVFERLSVMVTDVGTFEIRADITGCWTVPWLGQEAAITGGRLEVTRSEAGQVDFAVGAKVTGITITEGVGIDSFRLDLFRRADEWKIEGRAAITVLGHADPIGVAGELETGADGTRLSLVIDELDAYIVDTELTKLVLHDCGLAVDVASGEGESRAGFDLHAGATLTVGDVLTQKGRLRIARGEESDGLYLDLEGELSIPVPLPPGLGNDERPPPAVALADLGFGVTREDKKWTLGCAAEVRVADLPDPFPLELRSRVDVELVIEPGSFSLATKAWGDGVRRALPDLQRGGDPIPLGEIGIAIEKLGLTVKGKSQASLDLELGFKLPEGVNLVFGIDKGQPVRKVFETDDAVSVRLEAGYLEGDLGFRFALLDSPFEAIVFEELGDGRRRWPIALGPAGSLALEVPRFTASADGFSAGGGFKQDLRIPVPLIKELLRGRVSDTVLELLPDESVPLAAIRAYDDERGLNVQALREFVTTMGLQPGPAIDALEGLDEAAHRLPDRLKDYLRAGLPTEFTFDITVSATGSATFKARAGTEKKPEKLWMLIPAGPNLVGVELTSATFGPVLGGTLFKLEVDAVFDRFDVPGLVASVALADQVPSLRQARSSLIARDVMALVIYQTGFPIPIPFFFEEFGVYHVGPLGGAVKTGFSFTPSVDLGELVTTLPELWKFASDDTTRLPLEGPVSVGIRLDESYIELPPIFGAGDGPRGGRVLGHVGSPVFEADAWTPFARVLNGLKFFSVYQWLMAIPLEHRVQRVSLELGPLGATFDSVIATRQELAQGFQRALPVPPGTADESASGIADAMVVLPEEELKRWGTVLPPVETEGGDGLIVMMRGSAKLSEVIEFEAFAGMAATSGGDFATGLRLYAAALGLLTIDLECLVEAERSRKGTDFAFVWRALFNLGDHIVIEGAAAVRKEGAALCLSVTGREEGSKALMRLGSLGELVLEDFAVSADGVFKPGWGAPLEWGDRALKLTAGKFDLECSREVFGLQIESPAVSVAGSGPIPLGSSIHIPRTELDFSVTVPVEFELVPGWRIKGGTFRFDLDSEGMTLSGEDVGTMTLEIGTFETPQSPFKLSEFRASTKDGTVRATLVGDLKVGGRTLDSEWTLEPEFSGSDVLYKLSGGREVDLGFKKVKISGWARSDGDYHFVGTDTLTVAGIGKAKYSAAVNVVLKHGSFAITAHVTLIGYFGKVLINERCDVALGGKVKVAGFEFTLGQPLNWKSLR